jgi:hypothetical protein
MSETPFYATSNLDVNAANSYTNDQPTNPDVKDKNFTVKAPYSSIKENVPAAAVTAVDVLSQILIASQNIQASSGQSKIYVWASYKVSFEQYDKGTKTFDSISTLNKSGRELSIKNITFDSDGSPTAQGALIYSIGGKYMIENSPENPCMPNFSVGPYSGTNTNIIPSGYVYNPTNKFKWYETVTIKVYIIEKNTGRNYPYQERKFK